MMIKAFVNGLCLEREVCFRIETLSPSVEHSGGSIMVWIYLAESTETGYYSKKANLRTLLRLAEE